MGLSCSYKTLRVHNNANDLQKTNFSLMLFSLALALIFTTHDRSSIVLSDRSLVRVACLSHIRCQQKSLWFQVYFLLVPRWMLSEEVPNCCPVVWLAGHRLPWWCSKMTTVGSNRRIIFPSHHSSVICTVSGLVLLWVHTCGYLFLLLLIEILFAGTLPWGCGGARQTEKNGCFDIQSTLWFDFCKLISLPSHCTNCYSYIM